VDGSGATGDYIKDEFVLGQVGQAQMLIQIGLAEKTSTYAGIMGIGYDLNEATSTQYPNFMDLMVNNDITNTKLYSIWLNDLDSSTGSILFGGIDTDKYYGTLYSMPIHPNGTGKYTEFLVDLTSISYTPQVGGSSIPITNSSFTTGVVLESSTTQIYLPDAIVADIYSKFNVSIASDKAPYVDCKYSNSSYMSFGFESGSIINVPYTDFINKLYVPNPLPSNLSFTDVCSFGIQPAGS
jgi:Eukaryotic aspartyl protease